MYSVLQVTPALDAGGVERTTIEVAEAITRDGGKALVASRGGRLEPDLEAVGGELIRMPADTKNPIQLWANAARLERVARDRGVGVIHARSRAPAWSALIAARRAKTAFVTTYHGIYNGRGALKRFYNGVMARGDIVIANSDFTRQHVLREHHVPAARVVSIPRGIDLARFDPAAVSPERVAAFRNAWSAEDRFVALLPARITRWKGHHVLIEALARLKAEAGPRLKAVLAGDAQGRDGYLQELQAAIAARGLTGDVLIAASYVADMPAALLAADAVIQPSVEPEAFGRVAVEAQAMGRPVIAAAHGGFAETIRDGETGFLVAPGDADALAGALARVWEMSIDDRMALGARAAAHARAAYSKAALQASTLQVYRSLLGDRS